jgi:hypothetical protein
MMNTKQYDERQVQVRGQVFFHGFIVALALLMLNAFLQGLEIVWASPFNQNILICLVMITVASIELIIRGAYFGRQKSHWVFICLFGVTSIALAVSCLISFAQGADLITSSGLSQKGAYLIWSVMFIAIAVAAAVKTGIEWRKDK